MSSNISKLRIQSRLEATTRRERALAYAFSQQARHENIISILLLITPDKY